MKILFSTRYKRDYKKFVKKHPDIEPFVKQTLRLLQSNPQDFRLVLKKINCKRDKFRYSIRVLNTQYRILLTLIDDIYELKYLLDHDEYDRINKDC